jgi:hypothetical protein
MLVFCLIPDAYPGRTTLQVAKDWKKWRKSVLATGIATRLADCMRDDERLSGDVVPYTIDGVLNRVVNIIESKMTSSANDVKSHERDGFGRRRKKARALFSELQQVARAIGIKVKPTAYYFGK